MTRKRTRLALLGLILAGLLLFGVGLGISAYEFSTFTSGDDVVPGGEHRTMAEEIVLEQPYKAIQLDLMLWPLGEELEDRLTILTDPALEPGTLRLEAAYEASPGVELWHAVRPNQGKLKDPDKRFWIINLSYGDETEGLSGLLAIKDQLLADLESRTLREYREIALEEITVTVSPADRPLLNLAGVRGWAQEPEADAFGETY